MRMIIRMVNHHCIGDEDAADDYGDDKDVGEFNLNDDDARRW